MAMHIRPDNSLARSGFSSTVVVGGIGQMFAKPRPPTTTPATARYLLFVINSPKPTRPRKAERRKNVRGLTFTTPATTRPKAKIPKNREIGRASCRERV